MRQFLSVVVAVIGVWFFIAGLASVVGSSQAETRVAPVPTLWTSLLFGVVLLAGSVLLLRRRDHRGAGQRAAAADQPQAPRA